MIVLWKSEMFNFFAGKTVRRKVLVEILFAN